MTQISPTVREAYASKIMETVAASKSGIRLPDLMEKVLGENPRQDENVISAVVWHLLATHSLRFNATRKLALSSKRQVRELAHQ